MWLPVLVLAVCNLLIEAEVASPTAGAWGLGCLKSVFEGVLDKVGLCVDLFGVTALG